MYTHMYTHIYEKDLNAEVKAGMLVQPAKPHVVPACHERSFTSQLLH